MNAVVRLQSAYGDKITLARPVLPKPPSTGVWQLYDKLSSQGEDFAIEQMIKMVLVLADKNPRELGYLAHRLLTDTPPPSERNGYRYTSQFVCGVIEVAIKTNVAPALYHEIRNRLMTLEQQNAKAILERQASTPDFRRTLAEAIKSAERLPDEMFGEKPVQPSPPPLPNNLPRSSLEPEPPLPPIVPKNLPGCIFRDRGSIRIYEPAYKRYPRAWTYLFKRRVKYNTRALWATFKAEARAVGKDALAFGTFLVRNMYPYGPNAPTYHH